MGGKCVFFVKDDFLVTQSLIINFEAVLNTRK